VPAKPSPYAGPHRRTSSDFFAAASARNTGVVYASMSYVVFCDDLCILMPGWWRAAYAAARAGVVVAGAYQKRWDMVVRDGVLETSRLEPSGLDSRWDLGDDAGTVPIAGSQLFGCSVGAPRDLLVAVNGFDELCDAVGGEDWQCGVRLEWSGAPLVYCRAMLTVESEEGHRTGGSPRRIDPVLPPSAYVRRLRDFGVTRRQVDGPWDCSHMILDLLYGTRSNQTLGNYYLLETLDESGLCALPRRFPETHWFDSRALGDL